MKRINTCFAFFVSLSVFGYLGTAAAEDGSNVPSPLDTVLDEYEFTKKTKTCLSTSRVRSVRALGDGHILFRVGASNIYINQTRSACRGADNGFTRIEYEVHGGLLCKNQRVSVVDNTSGIARGACALGAFQRLERKADPEQDGGEYG